MESFPGSSSAYQFNTLFFDQDWASCVIDKTHTIIATNPAWDAFARENGIAPEYSFIGANCLQVALGSARQGDRYAREAVIVAVAVVSGDLAVAETSPYPCSRPPSADGTDKGGPEQWFKMRIRSLLPAAPFYLMTHEPCPPPMTDNERPQASIPVVPDGRGDYKMVPAVIHNPGQSFRYDPRLMQLVSQLGV